MNKKDIIKPVYDFFGIKLGDDSIIDKATDYLNDLIHIKQFENKRSYLWIDKLINVETVNFAITYGHNNVKLFNLSGEISNGVFDDDKSVYSKWITAQGYYILSILKETKEEDSAIQHWINYKDFILELSQTKTGCSILSEIYDLRGLDFFLYHYAGEMTSALMDEAMFHNARSISKALKALERTEEAIFVEEELKNKERRIINLSKKFIGSKEKEPTFDFIVEKLRVNAERFWNEYLSNEVWINIQPSSRDNLIDAFVTETLIENKILKIWSNVVLAIAKVIEKELSVSLFDQFINIISESKFEIPENISNSKLKKVKKRKMTFDMIYKCAQKPIHPPTLGQLVFVGKYWNDEIMDECTSLFFKCREAITNKYKEGNQEILEIVTLIEQNKSNEENSANIIDLRNASAHPSKENLYDWEEYTNWLKFAIGKPPKLILRKIINHTRL